MTAYPCRKLSDVCEVLRGTVITKKKAILGVVPVVAGGLQPAYYHNKANRAANIITVSGSGANAGFVNFYDQPIYASDCSTVLPIDPNVLDVRYVYFFMLSVQEYINKKLRRGAAQPHVYPKDISLLEIPLPPLSEQQRIVSILDEVFEGITQAVSNAEKNLANARELFESYLNRVFTQKGEGWVEKKLGDLCGFVRGPFGGSLKKSIFVPAGYAVYEQQHAIYNQFANIRYFVDEAKFKEMKRFELCPSDLIMSCSGTMGRVAIVPEGIKQGIINQALLKLNVTDLISNIFLKYWMESQTFQDALQEYSGGAAIQNVASVKVLKEIKILLPSRSKQDRIIERVELFSLETSRLVSIYQQKLTSLAELKQSILQKAFRGELTSEKTYQ